MRDINKKNSEEKSPILVYNKTVEQLIDSTKSLALELHETHIQESSWLIKNTINNRCKWYCISESNSPIVCWRWDNCNNFKRADESLKSISEYEHKKQLEDLY